MIYFTAADVAVAKKKKAKKQKNKTNSLNCLVVGIFKINSISFLIDKVINSVNGCGGLTVMIFGCGPGELGSTPSRGPFLGGLNV